MSTWGIVAWVSLAFLAGILIASLLKLDVSHRKDNHLSHLDEAHHGYWGLLLCVGILAALTLPSWAVLALFALGAAMLTDDAMQHAVQAWHQRYAYRSPGWRLYRWILEVLK